MNVISSLTIFFPAYNEAGSIADTISNAVSVAQKVVEHDNYEIIIVNDGSTDNLIEVVQKLVDQNNKIKLITHGTNQGYGGALMTGFTNATKDWVFFSDSDGQFDLTELELFIPHANTESVILGYRIKRRDPFMRLLNAKGWSLLNRIAFGLNVRDIDCAFKLFKKNALHTILPSMHSRGAMISAELLIRLKRAGYTFAEIGVNHYPRKVGSPTGAKPSVILRAFKELAQVYRGNLGNEWVKQVVKFLTVGVVNTIFDLSVYILLTRLFPFFISHKVWAKGVSFIVGITNSFIFNRAWTFRSEVGLTSFVPFIMVSIASLAINTGVMYITYESLGFDEFIALGIATLATLSWNFFTSKFIVFKN